MHNKQLVLSFLLVLFAAVTVPAFAQTANDDLIAAAKKGELAAVKAALAKGADVNARTNYGATALHFAADRGHLEIVKALVEAGADVNAKDEFYKFTPVMMAMMHQQKEVSEYLQKVIAEKKSTGQPAQSSPPAQATSPTPQSAANQQLNEELLTAAKKGDPAKVKELLAKGADVNAKTRYSQTPLMLAAQQGHTEIVKVLLEANADPNVVDSFYKSVTALSAAAERGHAEVVRLLLEKGAKGKENALAIAAEEGKSEVVNYILKLGGLNQQALDNALARAIDVEKKEIAEVLKKAGAKEKPTPALKPEVKIDEAMLQKYAGTYRLDDARQFSFVVQNGKFGAWDTRQYSFGLTAVDKNIFRIGDSDDRTITFNEESGRIVSITVKQFGFTQTYNRVEGK